MTHPNRSFVVGLSFKRFEWVVYQKERVYEDRRFYIKICNDRQRISRNVLSPAGHDPIESRTRRADASHGEEC